MFRGACCYCLLLDGFRYHGSPCLQIQTGTLTVSPVECIDLDGMDDGSSRQTEKKSISKLARRLKDGSEGADASITAG